MKLLGYITLALVIAGLLHHEYVDSKVRDAHYNSRHHSTCRVSNVGAYGCI